MTDPAETLAAGHFIIVWRYAVSLRVVAEVRRRHAAGVDHRPLARACVGIDNLLARVPDAAGESRDGEERVLPGRELSVFFEVYPDVRVVLVTEAVIRPPR